MGTGSPPEDMLSIESSASCFPLMMARGTAYWTQIA
jgi:hypothetical protein